MSKMKEYVFDRQYHEAFVYKWLRFTTGEFYVGIHLGHPDDGYIGSGYVFKDKYTACPDEWIREIIVPCATYEEALELEELIVDEITVKDPRCLNVRTGGRQGRVSEETKQQISNSMKGVPKTEEHKANMRKPKTREHALKAGAIHKRKVQCVETGEIFDSVKAAALSVGLIPKSCNISSVCKGIRKSAGGYSWRYVNEN